MPRFATSTLVVVLAAGCAPADSDPAEATPETASVAPYVASPTAAAPVIGALQTLFDALETGDAELLRSVVDPATMMHFAEIAPDGTVGLGTSTLDGLAERITNGSVPLIERMWDPVVRIDGAVASIWAPYDFYAGPDFSHCGVDVATLVLRDGAWWITGLSWTRRQPPECALHPEGPPGA